MFESRCKQHGVECRLTDVESAPHSPLKRYNPDMRAMIYGGFKLLGHLRRHGVSVYPFDDLNPSAARAYEIYPANTWQRVGARRTTDVERFLKAFNGSAPPSVRSSITPDAVTDLDAADAVVACVTLASAMHAFDLDAEWADTPPWATPAEWEVCWTEGLVVRAHP